MTTGRAALVQHVEGHQHQHQALDDELPGGVDAHDRQAHVQNAHDQRADDRAGDPPDAVGDRCPADETRGDGVQLVVLTGGGRRRACPGGLRPLYKPHRTPMFTNSQKLTLRVLDARELHLLLYAEFYRSIMH